jgi:tetratricopeptide (TPR) repeat protein
MLTWSHQSDDVGGRMMPTQSVDGWGDPYGSYETGSVQREPSSREVDVYSLEMSYDFGFATLTSSTSAYDHSGDSVSENTGFSAKQGWLVQYYYNYPRPMHSAERSYSDEAFIQEFRLVSNTEGMFDWIAGAFYRDQDTRSSQVNYLRNFYNWAWTAWGCCVLGDDDFRYHREENFQDRAVFGELTWNISEDFRLTGGFRYFDLEYTNDTFMGVGLYEAFHIDEQVYLEGSDSDTLFKLNASWDLNENAMVYGTVSEGFRRGGTNAVPLSGTFAESPAWLSYGPDTTTNYELGIKGNWNSSFYNVSLFYVDWEDILLNTATTNWAFYAAQNGSSATTQGVELEYDVSFGDGWRLNLGYAYTDGELDEVMWSADNVYVVAQEGAKLPGLAENTANMMLEYAFEFGGGIQWINRVTGYYQDETKNSISDTSAFLATTMDSFSLWSFNSNFILGNWTIGLFVKNMFNDEAVVGVFKEEYMGTEPSQKYYGNGGKSIIALTAHGVAITWNLSPTAEGPLNDLTAKALDQARRRLLEGDVAGSIRTLRKAEAAALGEPLALQEVAGTWLHCGQHEDAARCYARAVELQPANPDFLYNLATSRTAFGQLDEAERLFTRAIELKPRDYGAWLNRSILRKRDAGNNHVEALQAMLRRLAPEDPGRIPVCFALSRELEDLSRYDEAWTFLQEGAHRRRLGMRYDIAEDETALATIARCFDRGLLSAGGGFDSARPIFILGLPRSGTTLVDRILSAHSQVDTRTQQPGFGGHAPGRQRTDADAMLRGGPFIRSN